MHLSNIYYLHEVGGKKNQEDYIWPVAGTATLDDRIFIVCDGVGGSENGELASMIVARSIAEALNKIPLAEITISYIDQVVKDAKQMLARYVRSHGLNTDMATTFTLLVLFDDKAFVAWCGDSRVYHISNGEPIYQTTDHSLVNTLVKKGALTIEEARVHPQKNIILKAVKADESPAEYEFHWINEIKNGDYLMLCTDGVLENIDEEILKQLLSHAEKNPKALISMFQSYCLDKTRDNYSMYLLKIKSVQQVGPAKKKIQPLIAIFLLLLLGLLVISFDYLSRNYARPSISPSRHPLDSSANDQILTSADTASSPGIQKDSGVDYEIIRSEGRSDSAIPEASSSIIQPVTPLKTKKRLPSSARDSIMESTRLNDLSKPRKMDSLALTKPAN